MKRCRSSREPEIWTAVITTMYSRARSLALYLLIFVKSGQRADTDEYSRFLPNVMNLTKCDRTVVPCFGIESPDPTHIRLTEVRCDGQVTPYKSIPNLT